MRAVQLTGPGVFELRDVAMPDPGPGEIVLRVGGAGLCHTDLTLLKGFPAGAAPFTAGHETAGWVHAVGTGLSEDWLGAAVLATCAWGCGRCDACRRGDDPLCSTARRSGVFGGGIQRDGGLADYVLVPGTRHLVPLSTLAPRDAAPLADAAATPYHSIRAALGALMPGTSSVVIGVGGLGHAAIQLLRAMSPTRIVAVDVSEARLELAKNLGAREAVLGGGAITPREVRNAVGRSGASLVLDFVGSNETLALAASVVGPRGRIVLIGAAGGSLTMGFNTLPYEATLGGSLVGNAAELAEVVRLAEAGELTMDVTHIGLEDVIETYQQLEVGRLSAARAVAVP